jgi:hypothetical protein
LKIPSTYVNIAFFRDGIMKFKGKQLIAAVAVVGATLASPAVAKDACLDGMIKDATTLSQSIKEKGQKIVGALNKDRRTREAGQVSFKLGIMNGACFRMEFSESASELKGCINSMGDVYTLFGRNIQKGLGDDQWYNLRERFQSYTRKGVCADREPFRNPVKRQERGYRL